MLKIINKLNKLEFNKTNLDKINYDEFTNLISNNDIISLSNDLIKNILNKEYGGRIFLSIFLINKYNEEVFEFESELKQNLIKLSNELVNIYYDLNEDNIDKFRNKFKLFTKNFIIWKKQDKNKLINLLCKTYYNINNSKDLLINNRNIDELNDDENQFIKHYNEQQKSLLEKIKSLDGLELFKKYKKPIITYDKEFKKTIKCRLEDCYWDRLLNDLNSSPPKFDSLLDVLNEVKQEFMKLTKNNELLDKYIDLDLFKQQVVNNALDAKDIYQLMINICNLLKEVQAEDMDENLDKFIEKINNTFNENKFNYEFLVQYFKFIFGYFEIINDRIKLLKKK